MNIWKKIIRLLGLGAWPEANPRNVELRVHPRRGADLRVGSKDFPTNHVVVNNPPYCPSWVQYYGRFRRKVSDKCAHEWKNVIDVCVGRPCTGSVLGRKCIKCGDFDGTNKRAS